MGKQIVATDQTVLIPDVEFVKMVPRLNGREANDCFSRAVKNCLGLLGSDLKYSSVMRYCAARTKQIAGDVKNPRSSEPDMNVVRCVLGELGFTYVSNAVFAEQANVVGTPPAVMLLHPQHMTYLHLGETVYDQFDCRNMKVDRVYVHSDVRELLHMADGYISDYTPENKPQRELVERTKAPGKSKWVRLTDRYFTHCDRDRFATRGDMKIFVDAVVEAGSHQTPNGDYVGLPVSKVRAIPGFRPGMLSGMVRYGFIEYCK